MSARSGGFSIVEAEGGRQVGRFAALDAAGGFVHAVATRRGPPGAADEPPEVMAEQAAALLGVAGAASLVQVHGAEVLAVSSPGPAGEGDGLVTDRRGLALVGFSADCPIVLAADTATGAIGMAHASWRATVRCITRALIERMARDFGTRGREVVACVCPSVGPCCYEVGPEVVAAAAAGIGPRADGLFAARGGRTYFDLWAACADQLVAAGVGRANVHVAGMCTVCHNDLFPSYRAEGASCGRFWAAIAAAPGPGGGIRAARG